jgi:FkbM family methyltransferase
MELMPAVVCLTKTYGIKGIFIYARLKLGLTNGIQVPHIQYPVYLRKGSSDISVFQEMFSYREYEIDFDFQPDTIIDAGANIGLASVFFANRYPKATVIAIEPEKTNFEVLKKNTGHYKNIHGLKNAISSQSGVTLSVVDSGGGNWAFRTEVVDSSQQAKVTDQVTTITIPDIMKKYNFKIIDVVKIDIEGAEGQLFETYQDWLPFTRCMIIELHDRMVPGCSKKVFKAVSDYNFSYSQNGESLIFINEDLKK